MDELTTLSLEELSALREEKFAALSALFANETLTDEQETEALALGADLDTLDAEIAERPVEQSAEERSAALAALRESFTVAPEEAPEDGEESSEEDGDEDGEEAEPVEEAAEEEAVEAATKAPTKTAAALARRTPRPKAPEMSKPSVISITAAADVPNFATGSKLEDMAQVAEALVNRMEAFSVPNGDGKTENLIQYGVARFKMEFPDDLKIDSHASENETLRVIGHAANESRLASEQGKGSLVAAGGWCAPSETLYDLCVTGESLDGIVSLPEVAVNRGGIRFTKGPDFSTIYSNVGFLQTEAQAIAGTAKGCFEVPCPAFTEVRLDAIGLCIKAPILTNAAYPELIQRWLSGSMVAHAHKVNASVISRMVTLAGAAETVTDFNSTTHTTLSALELLSNYKRQTYKMGLNETLEVVLPYWVKSAIRDDLSLRAGITLDAVTDAMIASHFAARNLNVQWAYDWQELDTTNATEGYTATYDALLYPAGTFVKGTTDVIKLNAVYDAASLDVNTYTALFFEQGLLVANTCADADLVTLPVCNSGRMAINDISECGIAVAV
jgi:hypothetical protein